MNIRSALLTLCASLALVPVPTFAVNTSTITVVATNIQAMKTVDAGTKNVNMFSLEITSDCSAPTTIRAITFVDPGSDPIDVSVYVSANDVALSKKAVFDQYNKTATVIFDHPLSIPACQKKTIDVLADLQNTVGTRVQHSIMIELPTDIQGDSGTVSGSFPIMSNYFMVSAQKPMSCMQSAMKGKTAKERSNMRRECRVQRTGK